MEVSNVTCRLTMMTGTLRIITRTRIQIRGSPFRKEPEILSTIAFCRLSMADSLMVAASTATMTVIHTCPTPDIRQLLHAIFLVISDRSSAT